MDLVIKNARLRNNEVLQDIAIKDGKIAAVSSSLEGEGAETLDAGGRLTVPAFVNVHIHLDKCMLGEVMRPNVSGTLDEAIAITWDFKRNYSDEDIMQRAGRVIEESVKNGTTFIRCFVDIDNYAGLKAMQGMLAARKAYEDIVDIQLVPFPQEGIIRHPGTKELLREAMKMGGDIVGGLPWYEMTDEDMRLHIDDVFEIAREFNADIHMLVDDTDDANSRSLEYLAVKTIRENYQGRVSATHCEAMASYNDVYAAKVIGLVRDADINMVCNSHVNLVLAGRMDREPIRRGIMRVKELLTAGVNMVSAQDDVRDPYYPFGRPDQLEVGAYLAHTAQLTLPEELETVFDMITLNAARAFGLSNYGLEPGNDADIVVIDADNITDALRFQPVRSYVFKKGKIVASGYTERKLHR